MGASRFGSLAGSSSGTRSTICRSSTSRRRFRKPWVTIADASIRTWKSETRDWFARDVAHHLRPGADRALQEHRERGHQLVLLTSASAFAARAARDTWKLDDFLSNDFPTDDEDKLIGTFARPLCYGPGKVERARLWASERGVELGNCYFYSDSYTDAPMLRAVGHPRVVSPDPRLGRAARQGGWPILQW